MNCGRRNVTVLRHEDDIVLLDGLVTLHLQRPAEKAPWPPSS